jgi:hypothetical protein
MQTSPDADERFPACGGGRPTVVTWFGNRADTLAMEVADSARAPVVQPEPATTGTRPRIPFPDPCDPPSAPAPLAASARTQDASPRRR